MKDGDVYGISWGAAALGWLVANVAGVLVSPVVRFLYGMAVRAPVGRGEFTATLVAISLVSGFLAYLLGGYAAGRASRRYGGLNGAMAAVFGLAVGLALALVLSLFGMLFPEGVALPPVGFGLAGSGLLAGLLLFGVNLLAGYVGGRLGEPPDS